MRKRVLVIEDNPHDRELVGAFLDAARYEVRTAEGGRSDALEDCFYQRRFDHIAG